MHAEATASTHAMYVTVGLQTARLCRTTTSSFLGCCKNLMADPCSHVVCDSAHPFFPFVHRFHATNTHWLTYSIGSMDGTCIRPAAKPFRPVMAHLLGVRRVGNTVAATAKQNSGYIRYKRGEIKLLDRTGLEGRACSCYIRAVTPSQ
jgi:hypothetical protein